MEAAELTAPTRVQCPTCDAKPGVPCTPHPIVRMDGAYHRSRIDLADIEGGGLAAFIETARRG